MPHREQSPDRLTSDPTDADPNGSAPVTSSQGSLDLPARVGRYMLGPVVGVGGFAVVVRARDESLEADVAVKILTSRQSLDPEVRERFVREARLLRRVRNPSVVAVHDVGETADGRPYLVMDLADGGVLADRLVDGPVPASSATLLSVVTALAEGLSALHAAGVIHRDIKPANLLIMRDRARFVPGAGGGKPGTALAPGERLVIGDLGLAKDQLATMLGPTALGGTPGFQAPEQSEVGGRIDPRTDVYAATAVLWLMLTGTRVSPDELPVAVLGLPASWRTVLARGLATDPDDRFASIETWAAAVLDGCLAEADPMGATGAHGGPSPGDRISGAALPYKGLVAFQPDDAPLFFGRSELVDQLVARVQRRSALVVGGPSGSGKSSVVRAGLLPALAGGALPGSQQWSVCLFTPGEHPLAALRYALESTGKALELPSIEAIADQPDLLSRCLTGTTVLAVDQLEEIFTLCSDNEERDGFLRVLAALDGGNVPATRIVLAVRADFYGACALHRWLAAAINAKQVLVGPMNRAELRQAIEGPARRVGLHLQEGLTDQVLTDAGADAGSLPLVAHALVETWLRREGALLTLAGYTAAGGVVGAIARTADRVWSGLDADQQLAARRLLVRLVHPGDGAPDTKRLMTWTELGGDERSRELLGRFADARLVTIDDQGVQLAHEALLDAWTRLAAWIDTSRDELREGERIHEAAREWDRQGRHRDLLYRGLPLTTARAWRTNFGGAVSETTAAFLDAGEHARSQEDEAAELRLLGVRRRRQRVLVALATLTSLALVASVVAVVALGRSRRDARAALAASGVAAVQLARGLGAAAIDLKDNDPYLATVLAAESIVRAEPPLAEPRRALGRAAWLWPATGWFPTAIP